MPLNLYPWREQIKIDKEWRYFYLSVTGNLLLLTLIIFLGFYYQTQSTAAQWRLHYLQQEISHLPIHKNYFLKLKQYQQLLARIDQVTQLANEQVMLFMRLKTILHALPSQLYLLELLKNNAQWTLKGTAPNTTLITNYIKNLANEKLFTQIELNHIYAQADAGMNVFIISAKENNLVSRHAKN